MSDWTIMIGTGNYGMGPMHRGSTVQGISGTPVPRAPLGAPRTNPILLRPKAEQNVACSRRRQPLPGGTTGGRRGIADGYTRQQAPKIKISNGWVQRVEANAQRGAELIPFFFLSLAHGSSAGSFQRVEAHAPQGAGLSRVAEGRVCARFSSAS